ncbi:MAG: hypothetical protein ACOYON_03490 [Fimbriimonas sp.]
MMRGVFDAHGVQLSNSMLYGASGYAFVIHIHPELCPSSPYTWKREAVFEGFARLGVRVNDLGFFDSRATPDQRAAVEAFLRSEVDAGRPPGLINLEFQVVLGYDNEGFSLSQPWDMDFPPQRLSCGTWMEFGSEPHANFFGFKRVAPLPLRETIRRSLELAVGLYDHPQQLASEHCGLGPNAYALWREAIGAHGRSHGHWWNAMVWGEGRRQTAAYFREINQYFPESDVELIAAKYEKISDTLQAVANRDLDPLDQEELIVLASHLEREAVEEIRGLLS